MYTCGESYKSSREVDEQEKWNWISKQNYFFLAGKK